MKVGKKVREYYRELDRLMYQRDVATREQAALRAHDIGLEKGIEQGLEQGDVIGQIHAFEKLLKQPLTPRDELRRLSLEELSRRAEELERRLAPGGNGASQAPTSEGG